MDEEDYDMYGKNGCELDQQLLDFYIKCSEKLYE